jgi:hypothetical protein
LRSVPLLRSWLRSVYGPQWLWLFGLYLSLAVICGYTSWSKVVRTDDGRVFTNQDSVQLMESILSNRQEGLAAWPQIRTRLLVPYLMAGAKLAGVPYRVSHDALRLLFIVAAAVLFHWHLRRWFSLHEALTGTILVLLTITITFNNWLPVPTDIPELAGMTLCAGLLVRGRTAAMLAALAVATLNRETAIILVFVVVCWRYDRTSSVGRMVPIVAATVLTWAGAYLLARFLAHTGSGWVLPPGGTMQGQGPLRELLGVFLDTWPRRFASMMSLVRNPHPYNVNWSPLLVFNIFWILPLAWWRAVPRDLRRLYVGGLLGGLPIFALVGVLNEAGRHMIPLYPLVFPAGLWVLYRFVLGAPVGTSTAAPPPQRVGSL